MDACDYCGAKVPDASYFRHLDRDCEFYQKHRAAGEAKRSAELKSLVDRIIEEGRRPK